MNQDGIKLFSLCDEYSLYNSLQFPYNTWIIDIQSKSEYSKSHIITSINLPYDDELSNDDIIDILDINLGKYPNINKIYIYSDDLENEHIWLYLLRLKRVILTGCIHHKQIKDEFYLLNMDYPEFQRKFPFLCTTTLKTEIVSIKTEEQDLNGDNDINDDDEENEESKSFTVPSIIDNDNDEGSDSEVDSDDDESNDIWSDHFGANHDETRLNEIDEYIVNGITYPNMIENQLFLGDIDHAQNKEILNNLGITHIVNCTARFDTKLDGITYLKIPVNDTYNDNISQYFEDVIKFICDALKDDNNGVLIHCFAGISRSSTIAIAYFMKTMNMKYNESKLYVKSKRNVIEPNISFVDQLQKYEKYLIN